MAKNWNKRLLSPEVREGKLEMISAVIITKNEEKMLPDCLKSLGWVNEIVVIDTGNTDNTNEIAKKHKAKVIKYEGPAGFSGWRNRGLKEATGDWILYIDADERLTPELEGEILKVTGEPEYNAYAIPRRNFIFEKEFKHCGLSPDYVKRLFRKSAFRQWTGKLHEEPNYESNGKVVVGGKGNMGHLKRPLLHIKHETLGEMVEKTNIWSEVEAQLMFTAHHPPMNVARFASAALREFWLRMIRQTAFLDGGKGVIYAMYQVYSRFLSYAKLWEMQVKNESRDL
jgi:glycosyltransferase involved in cell wall biosynthesis